MRNPHGQILNPLRENPMPMWPYAAPSGASGIRFYVLLEDCDGNGPTLAKWVSRTVDDERGRNEVFSFNNIMDGAPAGYKGIFGLIDGEWVLLANECIIECVTAGDLVAGTLSDGTVGEAYSEGILIAGINAGTIAATGLPTGLTIDSTTGVVSGTPTTAGEYVGFVTGESDKTGGGTCLHTKAIRIRINPAPA